jgi:hypothetical protein
VAVALSEALALSWEGGGREATGRLMSEVGQLTLAVERKGASLGEPLLRAADAAELLSVRTSWI